MKSLGRTNSSEYALRLGGNGIRFPLRLNLRFFEESSGEKTEKPTQKKKTKAREEGQVAKSGEIGTAFLFISVFVALRAFAGGMLTGLRRLFLYAIELSAQSNELFTVEGLRQAGLSMFAEGVLVVLPIFAVSIVVGLITNIAQVGWHPTTKPLKPKFSKLNPMKGFKRMFSFHIVLDLVKSVLKFSIIALTIYNLFMAEKSVLFLIFRMDLMGAVSKIGNIAVDMAINVGFLYLFIAALDFAYQKYKHGKDLKMTKQEIKEEYKQTEGDPFIKGKIKQKMRESSMRRMMQQVPTADVIITNPTHFAIALKYENGMNAPVVIAKGQDYLALKIKEVAKENNIVTVENKPLARTLYSTVEIGQEIPPELYQAVAEILGYVYKLKNNSVA